MPRGAVAAAVVLAALGTVGAIWRIHEDGNRSRVESSNNAQVVDALRATNARLAWERDAACHAAVVAARALAAAETKTP